MPPARWRELLPSLSQLPGRSHNWGFIHEDPGQSFVLDIADLYRDSVTIPCAFRAAKRIVEQPGENIERVTRRLTGRALAREQVIPAMIDRIKSLFSEETEQR